ncbi:DUF4153 domain-containing protein [Brevundimonas sp. NIBR11]|uniref:DUF4153 domain-containing protein n=1 Tax=Brevundimonas sp. NIBR11 TaxID=3015999 RepID=UPI0022F1081C|nr:DUF4153 domain-containing protein [Brevundimonas sp. NIBR11]WGM31947.1 hypothetical protein KKHFBJBL_02198 [Brevundimonas sp. NIBR11]
MTEHTDTHAAGRADLRGNDDRRVGFVRLAVGLAQGIALYLLFKAAEGPGPRWADTHPELFGPMVLTALFLPPVILAGVGRLRWTMLAIWTVVAAAALAFLAWHDIARQAADVTRHLSPALFPFAAAALFIAHHLIVPADRERKPIAPFPAYFDAAWMAGVQLVLSVAFAGAFWLLLFLGAALFNIIGLSFLGDLIGNAWFSFPLTGLAFATAVHLTDVRDGLIRGVRTIALMLLSWLLLVLTVLVGGFLAALLFTGLDGLWETGSATALVLAAAGALIILINAAYQDGRPDNLPPAVLRGAVRVAALLLTPLVGLAIWGLALRIGQHGLTPDRIIAAACALVGVGYAIGYGLGALAPFIRKGSAWMKPLEMTNIVTAVLEVAVILALFTPLADPARLSVADQMARLDNGKVAPAAFDYAFLKFESGKVGKAALARLIQSDNPEIARRAREASEADNRYDIEVPPVVEPLITPVVEAWPADRPLPASFSKPFRGPSVLFGCRNRGDCVATLQDLNGDGALEILMASQAGLWLFVDDGQGGWDNEGSYTILRCVGEPAAPDARQLMKSGALEPRPAAWPDMGTGGRFASSFASSGPCLRAEREAAR